MHFLDVRARISDGRRDAREHAGNVARTDADAREATRARHPALDQSGQQERVDVAARQHQPNASPAQALGMAQQRRQPRGSCAFDYRLLDLQQHEHGLLDVALVHEQPIVHEPPDDFLRDLARRADRNALGDRADAGRVVRSAHRIDHRGKTLGLYADDLNRRLDRLGCYGHAGDESAAADRHHQCVQIRDRREHLQCDGALARDDRFIVVRMNEHEILARGHFEGMASRFVECVAVQHDLRAEAARALDLHTGREARHHDDGADPEPVRVIGDTLRVVAGTHRDDAARALFRRQLRELVARAPLLERGGELQVLELEEDLRAGDLGKSPGFDARRIEDLALQQGCRGLDVGERDHE